MIISIEGENIKKDILNKILITGLICLFIGVSVKPAFAIEIKTSANNIENEGDCEWNQLNTQNEYPPIICSILRILIGIIGPSVDLICLFLMCLGFTREQLENFFSPVINFNNSLLDLFKEYDCPLWTP
ncbi:MAG: hypothetical protein BV456_08035 [Thermoplasmata archaeon M8B2D]|nr:MAG: hypothetical protein BV456_08035 [Thermoplasmata archaeon M8B2D]